VRQERETPLKAAMQQHRKWSLCRDDNAQMHGNCVETEDGIAASLPSLHVNNASSISYCLMNCRIICWSLWSWRPSLFSTNSITCSQMLEMFLRTVCLQFLHCFSYFTFFKVNDSHIPAFSRVKLSVTLFHPLWQLKRTASLKESGRPPRAVWEW
jgi:hypothetical protein